LTRHVIQLTSHTGELSYKSIRIANEGDSPMLAEKFLLLLETLRSRTQPDGSVRVVSTSTHIPVQLPEVKSPPSQPVR
jgi:hypothetical protein